MDAKTAVETVIKPKLIEIFGDRITNFAIIKANGILAQGKTEQEKLKLAVNSICSDPKVKGMWGAAQTEKQKQEWEKLL